MKRRHSRRPGRPKPRAASPVEAEVAIEALGAEGDGLASPRVVRDGLASSQETHDGLAPVSAGEGRVAVPYALPGERFRVRYDEGALKPKAVTPAEALGMLGEPSAERAEPVCRHFGRCGGCALQHLAPKPYAAFKRGKVEAALRRHGLKPEIEPLARSPLGSRRRVRLALEPRAHGGRLGYRKKRSRSIEPIAECPIARPELVALFEPLRAALAETDFAAGGLEAALSLPDPAGGVDALLIGAREPSGPDRVALIEAARAMGLARLSYAPSEGRAPEPIVAFEEPRLTLGGLSVLVPAGAFMQPTAEGEAALHGFARDALGAASAAGGGRALDLFAGLGGFALALAGRGWNVDAFEVDAGMVDAFNRAVGGTGLAGRVLAHRRDLDRRPLMPDELAPYDAVVLDPPRAGALPQAEVLANSGVPRVVCASCNPLSFSRDAAILEAGGLKLARVLPVDQFLFSAEVELIGLFER